jgi:hypothetical protein
MNYWIVTILAFLIVALLPFFLVCRNLLGLTIRLVRRVNFATTAPPDHIKAMLQPAIAELEALEFVNVGYHQTERSKTNDEIFDWGVLLYDRKHSVFAGISVPELILPTNPLLSGIHGGRATTGGLPLR